MYVFVAAPFATEHLFLLQNWHTTISASVHANGDIPIFAIAVQKKDKIIKKETEKLDILLLTVANYTNKYMGILLKRIRLTRAFFENKRASIIWFVDATVRPPLNAWGHCLNEIKLGSQVVVIPYDLTVIKELIGKNGKHWFTVINIDQIPTKKTNIIGAGFGCIAITANVLAIVRFEFGEIPITTIWAGLGKAHSGTIKGENVGWFINAHKANIKVQCLINIRAAIENLEINCNNGSAGSSSS
jgi:hypothetical protein